MCGLRGERERVLVWCRELPRVRVSSCVYRKTGWKLTVEGLANKGTQPLLTGYGYRGI
jgi:hypothetical protein